MTCHYEFTLKRFETYDGRSFANVFKKHGQETAPPD